MGSEIHIELSVLNFKPFSEQVQKYKKLLQFFFEFFLLNSAPTAMVGRKLVSRRCDDGSARTREYSSSFLSLYAP